jgi:hypothetical protein
MDVTKCGAHSVIQLLTGYPIKLLRDKYIIHIILNGSTA